MQTANNSPSNCPLCGEHNLCARVKNSEADDCWCRHTVIPQSAIERIPQAQIGKSCICEPCAKTAAALASPLMRETL